MSPSAQFLYGFLKDFLKIHRLPHPGKKEKYLLPSCMTRQYIYDRYKETFEDMQKRGENLDCNLLQSTTLKVYLIDYFDSPHR